MRKIDDIYIERESGDQDIRILGRRKLRNKDIRESNK